MLLNIDVSLSLWEKFNHFLSSELGHVSDVGKGLNLVEMHDVVHHPQVIVVVHSDVKGLHCFSSTSTFGDSSIYSVFSLHELVVFGLDCADNSWSVNV